ncbi:MAG: radical SAM protein [Phycisphaerae bacterium]
MHRREILDWLRVEDERRLNELWRRADEVRRLHVGDEVHLRGLIEFSNHCVRRCAYCGLRAENRRIARYRMTADEILDCARQAVAYGYGTVVLQSGEDPGTQADWLADVVRRIKAETPLAVTLSLGEREDDELALWRKAGADRYLLRFETSNRRLYEQIHPPRPGRRSDRFAILRRLRELGYEVGSGVMIGIPGQTCDDLAEDIDTFRRLRLDMIGVGPYIAHPDTPLGQQRQDRPPETHAGPAVRPGNIASVLAADTAVTHEQVAGTELMTYKTIALARIVCPQANIPSTTALATLNRANGRELGLSRGANVIMPNLTPPRYRCLYQIYPAKACLYETAAECDACLKHRLRAMGRKVGTGRGDSPGHRPITTIP